jgi:spore maturation protein CgeB
MPTVAYPKFRRWPPRVLLVAHDYLLMPEVRRGLAAFGAEVAEVPFVADAARFVPALLEGVSAFRPDFLLTLNHVGFDADGKVLGLLSRLGVPAASWFVDRHELFLAGRIDPDALLTICTWDPEALASISRRGAPHAAYLPLAVDAALFRPPRMPQLHARLGFVGGSWTRKMAANLRAARYPGVLLSAYKRLGRRLAREPDADPLEWVTEPERTALFRLDPGRRAMFIRLVQLAATRTHRLEHLEALLGHEPLVVGDAYWRRALSRAGLAFSWRPNVPYAELGGIYAGCEVVVNVSSLQSRHALNQRIFDVPASGGFLLTDAPPSLGEVLEPGVEVAVYDGADDLPTQVARWLADPEGRRAMADRARRRILAEHTYERRLERLCKLMRKRYA